MSKVRERPEKKFRYINDRVVYIKNANNAESATASDSIDKVINIESGAAASAAVNSVSNVDEEEQHDSDEPAENDDSSDNESPKQETRPETVTNECINRIKIVCCTLNEIIKFRPHITREFETNETVSSCLKGLYKDVPALHQLYEMIDKKQQELKANSPNFHMPDVFIDKAVSNYLKMFKSFFWSYKEYVMHLGQFESKYDAQFSAAREKAELEPLWSLYSRMYTVYYSLFNFQNLLQRYANYFSPEDEEHQKAKQAEAIVSSILDDVNNTPDAIEFANTQRELSLLSGRQREPKINVKFIQKGPVNKIARRNGKIIHRHFVLFSDCLYLTLLPSNLTGQSSIRSELTLEGMKIFESKLIEVQQDEDDEQEERSSKIILNVKTKETDSDFVFDTVEELEFWTKKLHETIGSDTNDSQDDDDPISHLGKQAPRWQLKKDTQFCNGYNCKQKFTEKVRRHHCRADGLIYCSQCCNSTIPLSFELRRSDNLVCSLCYKILYSLATGANPEQLEGAKQKLRSVFKAKKRQGFFMGWVQMQTFSRVSNKLSWRARYFAELQLDPFLKLFKNEEDKEFAQGIMLVGMKICDVSSSARCQYHSTLKDNMFSIEHIDRSECYVFTVKTDDCPKWKESINLCIEKYLNQN